VRIFSQKRTPWWRILILKARRRLTLSRLFVLSKQLEGEASEPESEGSEDASDTE